MEHSIVLITKYLNGTFDGSGDFVRVKRRKLIELILHFKNHDLRNVVPKTFFENADLVAVDFSRANLAGLSFDTAFMIASIFKGANLSQSNLKDVFIRFADFTGATLTAANLKGSDWFNATGFNGEQLKVTARNTVPQCPGENDKRYDEAAFIKKHDSNYTRVRFNDFSQSDANDLRAIWKGYAGASGTCASVKTLETNR
jgi:uncharacterized protein YjbI with pentapeptide repeats